jgi:hypothetical protein
MINNVYTYVLFRNYIKHTLPLNSSSSKTSTQHLEGISERCVHNIASQKLYKEVTTHRTELSSIFLTKLLMQKKDAYIILNPLDTQTNN